MSSIADRVLDNLSRDISSLRYLPIITAHTRSVDKRRSECGWEYSGIIMVVTEYVKLWSYFFEPFQQKLTSMMVT